MHLRAQISLCCGNTRYLSVRGDGNVRDNIDENNSGSETLTRYDLFVLIMNILLCLCGDQRYSTMSQRTAILGHDLAGGLDNETGLRSSSSFCNRKSMLSIVFLKQRNTE